jgi:hypothetical protein
MNDYLMDQELWTASLLGAVGGAVTPIVFDQFSKAYDKLAGFDKLKDESNKLQKAVDTNDQTVINDIKSKKFFSVAFDHAARGDMEKLENILKAKLEESTGDESVKIQEYLDQIPEFEDIFNKIQNRPNYSRQGKWEHIPDTNSQLKSYMIGINWDLKEQSKQLDKSKQALDEVMATIPETELPSNLKEIKKLHMLNLIYESGLMKQTIRNEKDEDTRKENEKSIDARANEVKQELETLIKNHPEDLSNKNFNQLATTKEEDIVKHLIDAELVEYGIKDLKKDLNSFTTAQGQIKLLDKINRIKGEKLKRQEESLAQFIGEGVVFGTSPADSWRVEPMGDKFMLKKTGDLNIPGATTEEFTDEEYDKFVKDGTLSPERLKQVANKVIHKQNLTRKEDAVRIRKKEEIAKLEESNQNNNGGKGFTRAELHKLMNDKKITFIDNVDYRNRKEKEGDF